uniref:Serine dehydrogenase proteinase n=1 Tax=Marseillevirus LCMAC101 TaxID=2506602 RepID=A0A481YTM5_9VIRU|nr:MAG: serine dehydrogenase proteinase [Marseillevirus LCMAC101]
MLETICISVVVSALVWGFIWNIPRLLKGTRFSSLLKETPQESKIGNIWTSPKLCPSGLPIGRLGGDDSDGDISPCDLMNKLKGHKPAEKDEFAELLEKVEDDNDSKIIFINHRSTSSSFAGLSLPFGDSYTTLSKKDAIKIIDILRDIPDDMTLDIILNTTGGSMTAAEIIINALHNRGGQVRVYIPHYAQSAGLLIALAGNDIYLGKNAFVSPVDPQLGYGISAASVKRFCDAREREGNPGGGWVGDLIKLISGEARAVTDRIYALIEKIVIRRSQDDSIEVIQEELASGKYNHDKPLFFQDLNRLMRNVHPSVPVDIFRLFELHNKNNL